jgi:hypothetical protein
MILKKSMWKQKLIEYGQLIEVIPNIAELFLLPGLRKQAMLLDLFIFSSSWEN